MVMRGIKCHEHYGKKRYVKLQISFNHIFNRLHFQIGPPIAPDNFIVKETYWRGLQYQNLSAVMYKIDALKFSETFKGICSLRVLEQFMEKFMEKFIREICRIYRSCRSEQEKKEY